MEKTEDVVSIIAQINSTTAPDSLVTVKKFKAFMKQWEVLLAASKKKGNTDAALAAYDSSEDALKAFLTSVEL